MLSAVFAVIQVGASSRFLSSKFRDMTQLCVQSVFRERCFPLFLSIYAFYQQMCTCTEFNCKGFLFVGDFFFKIQNVGHVAS